MRKIILLSLILLNVLAGWAQGDNYNWMVKKSDVGSRKTPKLVQNIYQVDAQTKESVYRRDNKNFIRYARKDVLLFSDIFFNEYEKYFSKTYKLYGLKEKQYTTGQLDFCPTENELFMRLIWDNNTAHQEIHRIDITYDGIVSNACFHGTLEEACTVPAEQWTEVTTQQDMYAVNGDLVGFYNGNALFVEDTSAPAKDISAIRQSLMPKKSLLDNMFTKPDNTKTDKDNKEQKPDVAKTNPRFPGGTEGVMQWLSDHIKYPTSCVKLGIQGRVFAIFVVDLDGTITNINVVRSPHQDLSEETVRLLLNLPKWEPATVDGKPVRTRYSLPVMFRLGQINHIIK